MNVLSIQSTLDVLPRWFTSYQQQEEHRLTTLAKETWSCIHRGKQGPKHSFQFRKTEGGMEYFVPLVRLGQGALRIVTKKLWVRADGTSRVVVQYRPKQNRTDLPEQIEL